MAAKQYHSKQVSNQGLHGIVAYTYANETIRNAATGFISTDIYKVAFQTSDETFWGLTSISPIEWTSLGGGGSSSSPIVASVINKRSNGSDVPSTSLYTVPVSQSGLYRLTLFIGPASVNGFGQVFLNVHWPEFPPNTGNLSFMSLADETSGYNQASFLIGESSSAPGMANVSWWAQEGGEFTYSIDVNFWADGDYVYAITLEKLIGFSNP